MPVSITVEIHNLVFANAENGYTVARGRCKDEPGVITVVGCLGQPSPGETLVVTGDWKFHPRFGRQFEVSSFEQGRPATENGVIRFLASSAIKNVGPKLAERMVARFGLEVLDILDEDPERLLEVKGISRKKLGGIVESWSRQREIKNLIVFLHSHEVPPTFAPRIFQLWGAQSVDKLKENPYELAYEIRGVGFRTADNMALKLGFAPDAPARLEAAVVYALFSQSERGGHLFCSKDKLFEEVSRMLGSALDPEAFDDALAVLEDKKRVRVEALPEIELDAAVYLQHFWKWERETAQRLFGLAAHPTPVSRSKVEKALPQVEREVGMELTPEQREAVFGACVNKSFIITGGPGTGKTTITRAVVRTLKELGLKVKLTAPTGRAAKRMTEATGFPAQTVHRLLQYQPDGSFHYCEEQKLKTDALVLDEASMLDVQLFLAVLRALPLTSRLVLVGDANQLPSVGPGNVLADLLESGSVPSAVLTHIFRQARESSIILNAHRINAGQFPHLDPRPAPEADFFWVSQEDPARVQGIIVETVCQRIPERYGLDPLREVQVLTPMHKGEVGTQALNEVLQDRLNPRIGPEIRRGNLRFRVGDRVLQLRNNYDKDVFNGDLGWIMDLDPEEGGLVVDFEGNPVAYEASELDDLALAYAVSVHKSQGSEYPAVVLPVVTQHYMLLQRNLLYTALTRARRLAVLVGSERAFHIGLANTTAGRRMTYLRHRLRDVFAHGLLS